MVSIQQRKRPNLDLEAEVAKLEAELRLYKNLKLTSIERRINELLDELDDPATPQTRGQRLRERIGVVAATVALTALAQGKFDIPLVFQQPAKQEQVSPKLSPGLDRGLAKSSKPATEFSPKLDSASSAKFSPGLDSGLAKSSKPEAKPASKPELNFIDKVKAVAERIGADPVDLLTLMSFESAGTLSPAKRGPEVPGQGRAVGLIQFMPATARELGTSVQELANMTPVQQMDYVERYLVKRGFKGGTLKQLYSTVFAGHPNARGSISDGYHTLDSAVERMNREHRPKAIAMLGGSAVAESGGRFSKTKAIIETWAEQFQNDPEKGDAIAGYPVTSVRGWRTHPVHGTRKFHDGIDVATPEGTPIYAIADGVINCGLESNGGKYVSFSSPEFPDLRFDSYHLSKCPRAVNVDTPVKRGDIIGWTGNTGASTGPHLHLEINSTISGNSLRVRAGWLHWFLTGKEPK